MGLVARMSLLDAQANVLIGEPTSGRDRVQKALVVEQRIVGYLEVVRAREPEGMAANEFLFTQLLNAGLTLLICIALSALAAAVLAMHFRRPLQALVAGARALSRSKFDTRLIVQRSDELGELAHSFNQLAAKLGDIERAREQWIADTSHELRTPLSVLRAQLEAMQDGVRAANADNIALLLRQLQSLNKLVDELFELAKADGGGSQYDLQKMDLWPLLNEVTQSFSERLRSANLNLSLSTTPALAQAWVSGDAGRLRQLFNNLLENSLRYSAGGGQISIELSGMPGFLRLRFDDSAPGVPDSALAQLGQRFYRVEASRSRAHGGAGLGLSLCQKIVQAHGGDLRFEHSALGGLCVIVELPCA